MTSKPRKRPTQQAPQTETAPVEQPPAGVESAPADAPPRYTVRAGDGRPKCNAPECVLPEFVEGVGVCGGHYATQRGYANKAEELTWS